MSRYKCRRCRGVVTNSLWIPAELSFLPTKPVKRVATLPHSALRLPRPGAKPIVWKVCPRCLPFVLEAIESWAAR